MDLDFEPNIHEWHGFFNLSPGWDYMVALGFRPWGICNPKQLSKVVGYKQTQWIMLLLESFSLPTQTGVNFNLCDCNRHQRETTRATGVHHNGSGVRHRD